MSTFLCGILNKNDAGSVYICEKSIIVSFIHSPTATWKDGYLLAHCAEVKTSFSFSMTPLQKPADSELFRRACEHTQKDP